MKQEIIELQNEAVNSLFNLAMQGKENIKGPKQLGVFGAPYIWAIFRQLEMI